MLTAAMGIVIGLLVVVAFLLHAAGRARARALADDVRAQIEPYVRRKAAEAGIAANAPTWSRRSHPEEIVHYSSGLARRLLERERTGPTGPHGSIEYARTERSDMDRVVTTSDLGPPRR
jgi:hypothetical protein